MQPDNSNQLRDTVENALRIALGEPMALLRAQVNPDTACHMEKLIENRTAADLFPKAFSPEGALAGLWLRGGGWKQAHELTQNLQTREGFYWHALVHRQEPDGFNAKYWLRQVGEHPIFTVLNQVARPYAQVLDLPEEWKPGQFVDICVRPRTAEIAQAAAAIQELEWSLLFNFCVRSENA